jgi:hypothetical protein
MACKECEAEMGNYYLGEVEGITENDIMETLGITGGYLAAAKVDSYVLDWAKKQAVGSYGKKFEGVYYRSGAIGAAGIAALYFAEDMKLVKDMGKGAIVYAVKEMIAYAMPTMGIGNPDTVIKNIGNPDTVIKNIQQPNSVVEIGEQKSDVFRNAAIAENMELMKNVFNKSKDTTQVRITDDTSKEAKKERVKVSY